MSTNSNDTALPFDEAAYRDILIKGGASYEVATDVARLYAQQHSQKGSPAQSNLALVGSDEEKKPDDADSPALPGKAKKIKPLSKRGHQLINTGLLIAENPPTDKDKTYMHSIMCQIGLPRSKVDGTEFERTSGNAGIYIHAGKIWDGKKFVQQPIPYGPMPRLVMAYLNTQALRTKSPIIDVGDSSSQFMKQLGYKVTGGKNGTIPSFRRQVMALSACSMTLGFTTANSAITYDGKPIAKFEAWLSDSDGQKALWPGEITFSQEYFTTLCDHAVPLDLRALNELSGSALAMDTYAMLADRLHRINGSHLFLRWANLRAQFGQEYKGKDGAKTFKDSFLLALKKVQAVYPQADVKHVRGGVLMKASPPPIPPKQLKG
ncbi:MULTISPECIES: replication protein RepA [unclassified Halomonas]|uniref:replication protein RepA n=1 Tax=unclassified Halomonas TaxID=2609666 RepID=UPI001866B3F8|nr:MULTISPECIES: replication protein RepA [unclassified Halomonas]